MRRVVLVVANMAHPLLVSTFSDKDDVFIIGPVYLSNNLFSPLINSLFFVWKVIAFVIKNMGSHVVVNFHYPNMRFLLSFILLRFLKIDVKLSLWGSDFLKVYGLRRRILQYMIRNCSSLSVASRTMAEIVVSSVGLDHERVYVAPFRIPHIESFLSAGASVNHLDGDGAITVLCGTNGSENQQFPSIVNAINLSSAIVRQKAVFLFHMAYGGDKTEYILGAVIPSAVVKFDYGFYSGADLIGFRRTAQVLVQIQKTDQLSAAMIEHLALGAVVITGSWLPYNDLLDSGVYMYLINDAEELGHAIDDVLCNYSHYSELCSKNKAILAGLFSGASVDERWRTFFNSGI